MTMTFGFGAFDYLERYVGDEGARAVLAAFAKHAPGGRSIRAGRYRANCYEIIESGATEPPADHEAIRAAIAKASFASWANDDAPEMSARLVLPGADWNLDELREEDAIRKLCDADAYCETFCDSDQARSYVGRDGNKILTVADQHRLLTVYR